MVGARIIKQYCHGLFVLTDLRADNLKFRTATRRVLLLSYGAGLRPMTRLSSFATPSLSRENA
jgi:hypothetical protein